MKTFSTMPSSGEKMKKIGCPLCGSSEVLKLWDLEKYSFSTNKIRANQAQEQIDR